MSLKIILGSEPIRVDTLALLIIGQPGIGKTSLAFTSKNGVLLDFDHGAHRAKNRRASIKVTEWADVAVLDDKMLAGYDTIIVDTVGRALDCITAHIIKTNGKLARASGVLTLQGFGELKGVFVAWIKRLRAMGKDIVLLAHDVEEKDGDNVSVRPDIQGGSRVEVVKVVDLAGYLYAENGKRILDFSPTDRHLGKNCADFEPLVLPDFARSPDFLGDAVIARAKDVLNAASDVARAAQGVLDEWAGHMALVNTADDADATLALINKARLGEQARTVKAMLSTRTRELNLEYVAATSKFAPVSVAPVVEAPEVRPGTWIAVGQ